MVPRGGWDREREEPVSVWPLDELPGSDLSKEEERRIVALLTDPLDDGWSEEERRAFRESLDKFGRDFDRISKYIRYTVTGSVKTHRQCVQFYMQVHKASTAVEVPTNQIINK